MNACSRIISPLLLLCAFTLSHMAQAATLRIFPEKIDIHPLAASQRVIVTLTDVRGVTSDVTNEASVTLENASLARWKDGVMNPLASGETRLLVEHAGITAKADVRIKRSVEPSGPSAALWSRAAAKTDAVNNRRTNRYFFMIWNGNQRRRLSVRKFNGGTARRPKSHTPRTGRRHPSAESGQFPGASVCDLGGGSSVESGRSRLGL